MLLEARKHLDGNQAGDSDNGAIDKIESGDLSAAMRKIEHAVGSLDDAGAAGGPDYSAIQHELAAVAESMAAESYEQAVLAVDPPSRGEQRQLDRIRGFIETGRDSTADGDFSRAVRQFGDAVRRAQGLIS